MFVKEAKQVSRGIRVNRSTYIHTSRTVQRHRYHEAACSPIVSLDLSPVVNRAYCVPVYKMECFNENRRLYSFIPHLGEKGNVWGISIE